MDRRLSCLCGRYFCFHYLRYDRVSLWSRLHGTMAGHGIQFRICRLVTRRMIAISDTFGITGPDSGSTDVSATFMATDTQFKRRIWSSLLDVQCRELGQVKSPGQEGDLLFLSGFASNLWIAIVGRFLSGAGGSGMTDLLVVIVNGVWDSTPETNQSI